MNRPTCSACRRTFDEDYKFCPKCGRRLTTEKRLSGFTNLEWYLASEENEKEFQNVFETIKDNGTKGILEHLIAKHPAEERFFIFAFYRDWVADEHGFKRAKDERGRLKNLKRLECTAISPEALRNLYEHQKYVTDGSTFYSNIEWRVVRRFLARKDLAKIEICYLTEEEARKAAQNVEDAFHTDENEPDDAAKYVGNTDFHRYGLV